MRYVLDSALMQQCDKNTMEVYGMPSAVLMEAAALSVVEEIVRHCADSSSKVLLACGTGNNGGDGLAIARLLRLRGYPVTILFPGDEGKCSEEALRQLEIARRYGLKILTDFPEGDWDVVVDALFGIGLSRTVGGVYKTVIEELNEAAGWKVAVDIPSGISADHGGVMGTAFRADMTVTFGFAKIGQFLHPGAFHTGELLVKNIGIDETSLCGVKPDVRVLQEEDLAALPGRWDDSNKGTYGKVLIFAGSYNMAGAAVFSAMAAYRTGAGLVKVVTDDANRGVIQALVPEAILATYGEKTDMDEFVAELVDWADAIVLGPGIGVSGQAEDMVHAVLDRAAAPCLVDADGLNILAKHPDWMPKSGANLVFTPHLGEMSRLCKCSVEEVKSDLLSSARDFSKKSGVITVLKDARTVTALPDGVAFINMTGNHGMATAGSGDVLTGIIGALLGQKAGSACAAALGVMLHGMAGDKAAEAVGHASLVASDIIDGICGALQTARGE